ncbi:MAG: hypothetical protein ACXWL5_00990 [Candidatus Chromulinivorax sp.]
MKKMMLIGGVVVASVIGLYFLVFNNSSSLSSQYPATSTDGIKRRRFISNKLWRDTAPERLEVEDNAIVHVIDLDDKEYEYQLGLKLLEEADEVRTAKNKEELLSEIGDVYEVLDCIIALHNLSKDEIVEKQEKKRIARGSYLQRKFVTYAEYAPNGFMIPYCLAQPEKYQEVID